MNQQPAVQRTATWADALDIAADERADLAVVTGDHHKIRIAMLHAPHEVGTWSLEYLGPGFRVQLRIARRHRQARLDGWMSPARSVKVYLTSLTGKPTVHEAEVGESGRFEFADAPVGACRMSFVGEHHGGQLATPPFWI